MYYDYFSIGKDHLYLPLYPFIFWLLKLYRHTGFYIVLKIINHALPVLVLKIINMIKFLPYQYDKEMYIPIHDSNIKSL